MGNKKGRHKTRISPQEREELKRKIKTPPSKGGTHSPSRDYSYKPYYIGTGEPPMFVPVGPGRFIQGDEE